MQCEQARALFDAYLDGELSGALATEIGAHRVRCPECRRSLALLEVTGHIISSDPDSVEISEDFSDRLLACVEKSSARWLHRVQRVLFVVGPVSAAAVVGLAFLGVFSQRDTRVAGMKETALVAPPVVAEDELDELDTILTRPEVEANAATRKLDRWGRHLQETSQAKRQSVERLLQGVDMTITQWLDVLEKAQETSRVEHRFPGAVPAASLPPGPDGGQVESIDTDAP